MGDKLLQQQLTFFGIAEQMKISLQQLSLRLVPADCNDSK